MKMLKGKPMYAPRVSEAEKDFFEKILGIDRNGKVTIIKDNLSPIDRMIYTFILSSDIKPDTKVELISNMKEKEKVKDDNNAT